MRQFTSVDAQFVAAEDGRVHGHVTGLAIYDPKTSPTAKLTADDLREVWGVAGDPEQIDDAWGLIDDIVAAQAELLALVG